MKYFIAKIQYSEPVPEKDTIKKVRKNMLVRAESVTEVELKCQNWFVANWQDPIVKAVTETPIQEILVHGESETYWLVKVMFEDADTGKWTPYILAANGGTIDIVFPRVKKAHGLGEIEEIKKLKIEFDTDLLN